MPRKTSLFQEALVAAFLFLFMEHVMRAWVLPDTKEARAQYTAPYALLFVILARLANGYLLGNTAVAPMASPRQAIQDGLDKWRQESDEALKAVLLEEAMLAVISYIVRQKPNQNQFGILMQDLRIALHQDIDTIFKAAQETKYAGYAYVALLYTTHGSTPDKDPERYYRAHYLAGVKLYAFAQQKEQTPKDKISLLERCKQHFEEAEKAPEALIQGQKRLSVLASRNKGNIETSLQRLTAKMASAASADRSRAQAPTLFGGAAAAQPTPADLEKMLAALSQGLGANPDEVKERLAQLGLDEAALDRQAVSP